MPSRPKAEFFPPVAPGRRPHPGAGGDLSQGHPAVREGLQLVSLQSATRRMFRPPLRYEAVLPHPVTDRRRIAIYECADLLERTALGQMSLQEVPIHRPNRARPTGQKSERVLPTLESARGGLPVRDSLCELRPAALEVDRWVGARPALGFDPRLDRGLLELQEVQLHGVAAAWLPVRARVHIGHERDELVVVARQSREWLLEVPKQPVPG